MQSDDQQQEDRRGAGPQGGERHDQPVVPALPALAAARTVRGGRALLRGSRRQHLATTFGHLRPASLAIAGNHMNPRSCSQYSISYRIDALPNR
jgi:hypothetical protein